MLVGFSSLAALEVVKMITFSVAGGGGLVGVAAFPLQCQWICTMKCFIPHQLMDAIAMDFGA